MTITKEELSERFGVEVTAVEKINDKEFELTVKKMPDFPQGYTAKFRWLEADLDDDCLAIIQKWRDEYVQQYGEMDPSCFPDAHHTIIFGYCPDAEEEVNKVFNNVLKIKEPAYYDRVVALGPKDKENCWGVETDNPDIRLVMFDAKNNPKLNTNHPSYKVAGGWEVAGGDLPVKPHITLVRNLTPEQMRDRGTPILKYPFKARYVRVREWAGVKDANNVAFKFKRTCHLEKVYS